MPLDHKIFFDSIRTSLFRGRLGQDQVDGIERLLDECGHIDDPRHVAYILATAYHETGGRMIPVREGFAASDAEMRKIVRNKKYGQPDPVTGHVYAGRGVVQITWAENYKTMGQILGLPLYENPDLALQPDVSAAILVEGMTAGASGRGDFTGHKLADYFNDTVDDPAGARRIVNGYDRADHIAGIHKKFLTALQLGIVPDAPAPAPDLVARVAALEARLDAMAAALAS